MGAANLLREENERVVLTAPPVGVGRRSHPIAARASAFLRKFHAPRNGNRTTAALTKCVAWGADAHRAAMK